MVAIKLDINIKIPNPADSLKHYVVDPLTAFAKNVFAAEQRAAHAIKQRHDTVIEVLQEENDYLDEVLPPNKLQKFLHTFYQRVLAPILEYKNAAAFNAWIDSNGHGNWYQQLGTALAKLPLRAVRNILAQVYALLKALIHAVVHPIKALNDFEAFCVHFTYALTLPQTYTRTGAGIMGASLGHSLAGFPFPTALGFGFGGGLMVAGIAYDALRTLVQAQQGQKWKSVKEVVLHKHVKHIPEAFVTGLVSGLVAGVVQKNVKVPTIKTRAQADRYLNEYRKEYHLRAPIEHWFEPETNRIVVCWGYKRPRDLPHGYWGEPVPRNSLYGSSTYFYSSVPLPLESIGNLRFPAHAVAQVANFGRREN